MQRGGSRIDKERNKIQQARVPGQLLQSGEGDGGEASANVRQVEATDKDREENINKDMQVMKQRYDAVNSQLGSLETRMDTMDRDQAESSCAIQAKLDAILRYSTSQDRPVTDRTKGNRVDFVEPQRNKRESTPLPLPRGAASIGPGGGQYNY